ncbi:hypothetical protein [Fusibacter ferrireducens]|uniref:Uncharacterized protein n=1 Tax=Fusibacter ferrireducens TaxID=2785058 RepID=A0ABR9ZNS5_9FIRM|nr:hypothetical protein [Fusibacter ferrireducens]MBF4692064.1 hypothetical protein [Fusibacter ferrireducens]
MNLILENSNQVENYTYLNDVFNGIDNQQVNYNWLISDIECNYYPTEIFRDHLVWISGEKLTEIINKFRIQFIWAVLSGIPKSVCKENVDFSVMPFANGNDNLWTGEVTLQHPQAKIEIVCWDSESTLLITDEAGLSNKYLEQYSDAKNLDEMNILTSNQINYIKSVIDQYYEKHEMNIEKSLFMALVNSCRIELCRNNYRSVFTSKDDKKIIETVFKIYRHKTSSNTLVT